VKSVLKSIYKAIQQHPRSIFKGRPSERIGTPFSLDLFSGKDTMMNIHIHTNNQSKMATHLETIETDLERLVGCGFTSEEIVSLLWLQKWYQTGGSDRIVLWATGVSQAPCSQWQVGPVTSPYG
jgi:hypothetical protein